MPIDLSNWADRLVNQPLPAMALTARRVTLLIDRPSTVNADYQWIIGVDPGYSLAVFRAIEKAPHRPLETAGNLAHAIALLGVAPLIAGTKNLPVLDVGSESIHQGLLDCYSQAAHAAWYAYHWGLARNDPNPEEMAVAALLHDCAAMALWSQTPEVMEQILRGEKSGQGRDQAATQVLGFQLDQLSLMLSERWRLPPLVAGALTHSGAFESRSLGVMLASSLAKASAADWQSEQTGELIELAAEYLGHSVDQASAGIHSLTAAAARLITELPLTTSAHCLVQHGPGVTTNAPPETVVTDSPSPARRKQTPALSPTATPPVKSSGDQAKPRTAANRLQQAFSRIMREVKEGVGMDRTMFAILTPDKQALRPRFVLGADQASPLRGFQLSLDRPHLFSLLMAKPQSFWLHAENRGKFLPMIPAPIDNTINDEGFFVTSLFVRKQPLGLLYGDCADASQLTRQRFDLFKELSRQLSDELGGNR